MSAMLDTAMLDTAIYVVLITVGGAVWVIVSFWVCFAIVPRLVGWKRHG